MPVRWLVPLFLAPMLMLVAACDDADRGTASPTPTDTAPILPTVTLTASPAATSTSTSGDAIGTISDRRIRAIIEAVEARDLGALSGYVALQTEACTHALGIGGPPKCAAGQAEGDLVQTFPVTSCEAEWHSHPVMTLGMVLRAERGLYAAVEAPDGFNPSFGGPVVDTLLVFHADRFQAGFRLNVTGGRVTSLTMGCDTTLEDFASAQGEMLPLIVGPLEAQVAEVTSAPETGLDALDATLAAVARYDHSTLVRDARRAMEAGGTIGCEEELQGPGGIECDAKNGEAEGTPVSVFPSAYCEGSLARSPAEPLQSLLNMAPVLHSVYEAPSEPSGSPVYRNGAWWVVCELTATDAPEAVRLNVAEDGTILAMWYGCVASLESVTQGAGADVEVISAG